MKVLFAASEVTPFAKTGGLADVAGSLPVALGRRKIACTVIMPLYRSARNFHPAPTPTDVRFSVPIGARSVPARLWKSNIPGSQTPIYFVEQDDYFDRDDKTFKRDIYQFTRTDGQRTDYPDNCERFAFFSRAILEAIRATGDWPDVLHLNDWQTGLAAAYLQELYRNAVPATLSSGFQRIRTLFSIHNLAYQGLFWHLDMPLVGLPWRTFHWEKLEFFGKISFLKAGLTYSNLLNTVSPTYAREIQTPYFGCGLQGVLLARSRDLSGIINGVDYSEWDSACDSRIAAKYDPSTAPAGKARCKAALQSAMGLPVRADVPLLGVVSRLAAQKGFDLFKEMGGWLVDQDVQLVVLGAGDAATVKALEELRTRRPDRVGLKIGFSEDLAHQIEAGSDAFLMPSQYEPCGLNQLYSLKYGTIPVVRRTGGLADTVTDATDASIADGTATGFVFGVFTAEAFRGALERCLLFYRQRRADWRQLQITGMMQDWSWDRSAGEYEALYRRLLSRE